jgi:hypothetical protein
MTRKCKQLLGGAVAAFVTSLVFVTPISATPGWETIARSQASGNHSNVGSALASKPIGLRFEVQTGISSAVTFWTDTCSKSSSPTLVQYGAYRVNNKSANFHVIPVASKADWCSIVFIIIANGGSDRIYLQKELVTAPTRTTTKVPGSKQTNV